MIPKEHIHILEIISILLFSLLGNYLIGIELNFHQKFSIIICLKVLLLSFASFSLYFTVVSLTKLLSMAEKEYFGYMDLGDRAKTSIDEIYYREYLNKKNNINTYTSLSIISVIVFFLIEPIIAY